MADTIPKRLLARALDGAERPAYLVKRDGAWQATTWKAYADEVVLAARALVALGFEPGERISLLGFNRPEWTTMHLAAMAAGGASAGIYTTSSPDEIAYIVGHSDSPLILVETADQLRRVEQKRADLPRLKYVVLMRDVRVEGDKGRGVLTWEDFLSRGAAVKDREILDRIEALEPSGLASLIYTSGTTGPPKAVMLTHENLAFTANLLVEVAWSGSGIHARTLSYLPLSHIAEQMISIHGAVSAGSTVYFAESIDKVADNLKEVRPTLFFGVPRIWEKFYAGASTKLAEARGAKAGVLKWARGVGLAVHQKRASGQPLGAALSVQYELANRLVFTTVKELLGLDQASCLVSGAAPIGKEIIEFFASLDLPIQEIYGQSEDSGPTTFNRRDKLRIGSVGALLPGIEVKIAPDDEVLVRGKNVFSGYFRDPEATKTTLVDGWLHTGDLGRFDADGFLAIIGRKKDIIITAGGKNITPANIEEAIKSATPLVSACVVIGDRRKYLTALVWLEPEALARFAKEKGLGAHPATSAEVRAEVQQAVDKANQNFARVEQIKKFVIPTRPLSIDGGELTPTLKIKRNKVVEHFAGDIDGMYAGD